MKKEKIKEILIDVYGATVYLSALTMMVTAIGLGLMSVLYITESNVLQAFASILIAGLIIYYSITLMKQIVIDRGA
jgi:divalent metal cation (Fe/Co/Zn/Cd) transporter